MRDDLHRMELADRYLDGAMSATERSEFEATAAATPELRQVIDEQRALREGMQRLHLRVALSAAHTGWVLKQWLPKIITLIVVGGLITAGIWYVKELRMEQHDNAVPMEQLDAPIPEAVPIASPDSGFGKLRVMYRDSTIDTVIYLIKDGKRIRLDSIPKGARIIGTEMHPKVDTIKYLNESSPAAATPAIEYSAQSSQTEKPEENTDAGINYLSTDKPPTHLGQGTEMQILRPKNAESQPQYPGGFDAMYLFLKKNLRVPDGLKLTGTVVVSFVVDEKGAIKDAVVEQGLNKACDAEALRVVKTMPKWIPCQAEGKPVRSRIEVPLTFSAEQSKNKPSDGILVPVQEQPVRIPRQLRNGGG